MSVASPERYLADLNEAQREAVVATEGPLLVVAGAGSGKTRVLTYRVAHLVNAVGVKPNEILAITFTNKAAQEMKTRLEDLLGGAARAIWILTFHAACGRMLRREAPRLGYRTNFTIYDQADQIRLVKQCLEPRPRQPPAAAADEQPFGGEAAQREEDLRPRRRPESSDELRLLAWRTTERGEEHGVDGTRLHPRIVTIGR